MRKSLIGFLSIALLHLNLPTPVAAQPASAVKSSRAGEAKIIEFQEGRIDWNVVLSDGGDIDQTLDVEVPGRGVQLIMGIIPLGDFMGPLEKVRLDARDPEGTAVGSAATEIEAERRLGLTPLTEVEAVERIGRSLGRKVLESGPSHRASAVAAHQAELDQAFQELRGELESVQNAGFVYLPSNRFENRGFQALQVINPTRTGTWKMELHGRDSEPFLAVSLVFPLQPTAQEQEQFRAAAQEISSLLIAARPAGLLGDSQACDTCVAIVASTGVIATIVALVAGFVSAGTGTVATIALYLGAVAAALGVSSALTTVVAGILVEAFQKDFWCGLTNSVKIICYGFGKGCPFPC